MSIFDEQIERAVAEWKAKRRAMGRPVREWVADAADAAVPYRIRQRVLETWDGVCYLSTIRIDPAKGFDVEHVVRVKDGGGAANREGNMRPALRDPHIAKTAREKKEQAEADRRKRAGAGTKTAPTKKIESAPMAKAEPQKKASKPSERIEQLRSMGMSNIARRFADG